MGRPVAEPSRELARRRERRRPGRVLATSRPAVALGRGLVRALARSLRIREFPSPGLEAIWRAGTPVIYAVWHGQILLLPLLYGRRFRIHALTSRSRDGEILSRFVEGFGIRVVRGSSSRGGARAFLSLARVIRDQGDNVLIVPDGPRGPRHVAQNGAVMLAKVTGVPIVPLAVGASPCRVLRSWDAFVVPRPFGRVAVVFGEPIAVPRAAVHDVIEAKRRELEAALQDLTAAAASAAGGGDVPAL
ncbi:MAG TPA: lysophospholipid acyltransferase family protein [Methylomirabilota bacterium]|jgi:hypothetical protein|nr:lysophospholipid acyltransferase family protein [Methylomirabilota bacterium]